MASYKLRGNNFISCLNYGQAAAALHISSTIKQRNKILEKDILDLIIKTKHKKINLWGLLGSLTP